MRTNKNVYEQYLEQISKSTGFEKEFVDLIESKRSDIQIPVINCHKFVYKNQIYILIDNKLV